MRSMCNPVAVTPQATQGIEQRLCYHKGVGTSAFDHFRGGALGVPVDFHRMFGELVRPIPLQRYNDEGRPVVTNEKAADLAIVRLRDPSYQPPNLITFRDTGGPQAKV